MRRVFQLLSPQGLLLRGFDGIPVLQLLAFESPLPRIEAHSLQRFFASLHVEIEYISRHRLCEK